MSTWRYDRLRGQLVEVPDEEQPAEREPWRERRARPGEDLTGAVLGHLADTVHPVRRGDVGHLRRPLDGFGDPFRPGG